MIGLRFEKGNLRDYLQKLTEYEKYVEARTVYMFDENITEDDLETTEGFLKAIDFMGGPGKNRNKNKKEDFFHMELVFDIRDIDTEGLLEFTEILIRGHECFDGFETASVIKFNDDFSKLESHTFVSPLNSETGERLKIKEKDEESIKATLSYLYNQNGCGIWRN